jgi:hypothetical protein
LERRINRALVYAAVAVFAAGAVLIGLRGCTVMPWNSSAKTEGTVSVSITRDFGREIVRTGRVSARGGESVLDVLQKVASVETDYGGGFVSAIDGTRSSTGAGVRKDWFYYVNGVMSGVGAGEFRVLAGDVVWWDYHQWNGGGYIPAVVGAYPAPFTRGYSRDEQQTTLISGSGMNGLAREVGEFLRKGGADVVFSAGVPRSGSEATGPTIAILSVKEASDTKWAVDALERPGRSGALVALEGGGLAALDSAGRVSPTDAVIVAAVVCVGSGMGDASPVWLVLCDGQAGDRQARRVLVSHPGLLGLKAGVAVDSNGRLYALPR